MQAFDEWLVYQQYNEVSLPGWDTLKRMGRKARLHAILAALRVAKKFENQIEAIPFILGGAATVSALVAIGWLAPLDTALAAVLIGGSSLAAGAKFGASAMIHAGQDLKKWVNESIANIEERLKYDSDEDMEAARKEDEKRRSQDRYDWLTRPDRGR